MMNKKTNKEMGMELIDHQDYSGLLTGVTKLLEEARHASARSVNEILTVTYWEIGRRIVEYEQKGSEKPGYGEEIIDRLGLDLTHRFGRGFSRRNLFLIRSFYLTYRERMQTPSALSQKGKENRIPSKKVAGIVQTVSALSSPLTLLEISQTQSGKFPLSWSHYVRLLSLDEPQKRDFYEEEAQRAGWSVRQLDRQINSMLYERFALSKKKGELLKKAEKTDNLITAEEAIKDPYMLEFLGLPEPTSERDLENALIQHMTDFLLELGFGFTFVARQKRLQIGSESYYLDLLFYHRGLRCLVAIDLKVGKFTHADAGQMNLYLNYLLENEKMENENDPIGLILCSEKDESVAHYALGRLSNKIFASRYKLQLPDPEVLKREIEAERKRLEMRVLERKHNQL
jgi:predicted nuclease of restriction endonuclease-like (RecB) superfamily